MDKYYITEDKIAEFVARMWKEGVEVRVEPKSDQLTVCTKTGGYEWIKVFRKQSFEDLMNEFIPNEQEA